MTTQKLVAQLRDLANFVEANPELPWPASPQRVYTAYFPNGEDLDEAKRVAQLLHTFEKDTTEDYMTLKKTVGENEATVEFVFYRNLVCVKRSTGFKEVIKLVMVNTPEDLPEIEYEDQLVQEEQFEWDCPSLLTPIESPHRVDS